MDFITKVKSRLECKIIVTLQALLPNKIVSDSRGWQHLVTKLGKTNQTPDTGELYL